MIRATISNVGRRVGVVAQVDRTATRASAGPRVPASSGAMHVVYLASAGSARMLDKGVAVSARRVMDVRLAEYLKVDKDVIWVTPDMWEKLLVMSNVEWQII